MFRRGAAGLEVLLVHPGGPYFSKKDAGSWSIPKGEAAAEEVLLERAKIEFHEELGFEVNGSLVELGSVQQKGGKIVHAWAFENDLPSGFELRSNTFQIEWPPRSGTMATFPEVDRAEFFPIETAREKINAAQTVFLDRLAEILRERQ